MISRKGLRRDKIRMRIRNKVRGTLTAPRLSVYRSNKYIYAQIINDVEGITLASASSKDANESGGALSKTELSFAVGENLARIAMDVGVKKVVFDRGGYLFHGRVKALADGARKGGLVF